MPTWFLVEENDGLTGRKGTVVVSLKRALWFCVASQTNDKWTERGQNKLASLQKKTK